MADVQQPELDKTRSEAVEDLKRTATVDTVHNDEAVRVLANYTGDTEWSDEEEKLLVKKIDRRLLSIVITTYGLQYYDKAMLSQAVSPYRAEKCSPADSHRRSSA